ncbi:GlxA family transcriptional regulator [Atopomonas sediminilitoris]|uniref:GlxA family transcriptional regulator n=1 Tax=Atopomonas sediminilitoris TaxID=2919919 RepID=UPI001F4D4A68|nr:GlxA family transcriptional regulator [Atopomonas sediminilitoris]MCJ8169586.1 GlxA family transcriptional regulator [Atopomonas sediminilitoris]
MKIAILMSEHCASISVSAALETFGMANALYCHSLPDQAPLFELYTASLDGAPVTCSGGLILTPQHSLASLPSCDLIMVPGYMFSILRLLPTLGALYGWLQEQHARGCAIASLCTGAFICAEAGLLDGRNATTHWAFAAQFARRYPQIKLQAERTLTEDGLIYCAGGANSGSDLLLHLIRKFGSPQLAADCAKHLLIDGTQQTQQPYASTAFKKHHGDGDILKVQVWLERHLQQPIVMERVAEQFNIGTRHFIRRFKEATEQTPIHYLQNLRLEKARLLLENSDLAFDQITLQVGYEDHNSFRRLFKQRLGLSPSEYRRKFQPYVA